MVLKETDYWGTPYDVARGINAYLKNIGLALLPFYDLDCCANEYNTQVRDNFITEEQNALAVDWNGRYIWCNPPYSRGNVDCFINKAIEQVEKSETPKTVVMLLNVDTSTRYFEKIVGKATAIFYITGGRIRFINHYTGDFGTTPTKPNMFVVFSNSDYRKTNNVYSDYVALSTLTELGKNVEM